MAQLRPVADEIVLAFDSRTDERDIAEYRAVADRVVACEFDLVEAHLAWLHAQCSGDWILRLDGDEVPSPALVAALPELTAVADLRQYWFPRRWLDPTGSGWLDELPWSLDYHNRLVRNDETLCFEGRQHTGADPAEPARYLREPFYHLLFALETKDERLERGLKHELARPNLVAPGGGPFNATFYLPERFARRPPLSLPAEDRPAVEAALTGGAPPSLRARPRQAPASQTSVELVDPDTRLYEGEVRALFVEVRNASGETWPGGLEAEPRIRLSYRLRAADGALLVSDGPRSPLTTPLRSGESAITPLTVVAPAAAGPYQLEVDLVHEDVRWLECGFTAEVEIVPPGETERNVTPRRWWRRQWIPRVIHRVWIGPEPLPSEHRGFGETWRRHHPGWEHCLWTDGDLPSLAIPEEALLRARDPSETSNLVRYHVLAEHGGVYVDTDFECLRSIEPLLGGIRAFAASEGPGRVGSGIIGATPGHPALRRVAELSLQTVGSSRTVRSTGPVLFSHVLCDFPEVTIFPPELFFPYLWDEPHPRHERFDGAYAVHHWARSWDEASQAAQ
jgi:hypothetical protein